LGFASSRLPALPQRIGCPHPSRFLRRVGCHCSSPEALPRNFCLSHPSQKARRMGHPILCGRARNTRLYHSICPWFSSPWVSRRLMGTRLKPCPSSRTAFPRIPFRPLTSINERLLRRAEEPKFLKGTACLAAASFRPYITDQKSLRLKPRLSPQPQRCPRSSCSW